MITYFDEKIVYICKNINGIKSVIFLLCSKGMINFVRRSKGEMSWYIYYILVTNFLVFLFFFLGFG